MKKTIPSLLALTTATVGLVLWQPHLVPVSVAQVTPQQDSSQGSPDPRVQAALDGLGFNYEIQDSGAFRIGLRFEDGRTQVAFISSGTSTLGDLEIRDITSPVNVTDGPLSAETANQLLQDNASKKLGAWQTVELSDQRHLTMFTARIDANSSPEQLQSALYGVLYTADAMEAELSDSDRF
ncbi:hypothetical protein XM38_000070 [Halomicronema hongdechloris C2206]|uniref:YbjN domain-containing protein n=1 Tax=Halomicronema hongdechloris C2206 TaxID=1641165 RepID=A0A1Z3HFL1_9CYAN|nr:hypothetical protein [Halomicronema hongdechloris]ASC69081.1 hypothetical protein XM38_000070 [Halomicronema hongdechloris C2206]